MKPHAVTISDEIGNSLNQPRKNTETNTAQNATVTHLPRNQQGSTDIKERSTAKPVSQAEREDPREFQISQVVRRYSPFRADLGEVTTLKFKLAPTDPDFLFDLESGLQCLLRIPIEYPKNGRPTLTVQNAEMARGFQINVEKGFDELVTKSSNKSLLALLNELDRNLERLLTSTKAPTVKFVANRGAEATALAEPETQKPETSLTIPVFARYDDNQLREAKARRDAEIRQLEARLGRSELFSKVGDGIAFNVPVQLSAVSDLPAPLRAVRDAALIVPEVYPLEPCTIVLKGVYGKDAENVEVSFEKRAVEKKELSLMAHINYLTQNLGKMAVDTRPKPEAPIVSEEKANGDQQPTNEKPERQIDESYDPLRPHIRYMAKPPEWNVHSQGNDLDESDSSSDASDEASEDEIESTIGGAPLPVSKGIVEKGIQVSFPGLEMIGIGVLHVHRISVSVKCDRCKEQVDMKDLASSTDVTATRSETCQKCSATLTATYYSDLMHVSSNKAGHIEVENCSIVDLLPSVFQPTCLECGTTFPSPPGVVATQGDSKLTVCRSCHAKMTFKIPEVKFLRVSTAASHNALPLRSRKPKEKLGISAGTPLPDNGRCQHYSKSYRWFRFSCCNRVFPCDKCHDSAATNPAQKENPHANEHAERMICGWCSREQRYHPEECRMCGRSVVKKTTATSFWEGGRGQRDKSLMSKNEGRKFKRSGAEKKALEATKKNKEAKGKGGMWWPV